MGSGLRRHDGNEEPRVTQPLLIEHHDAMMTASPVGLRLSKECLNMSVDAGSIEAVIAMEDRNQVLCSRSEEIGEGIRAFLEKRKPVYIKR
jgi:enoyl-CoA hydratase/carnithine racemase